MVCPYCNNDKGNLALKEWLDGLPQRKFARPFLSKVKTFVFISLMNLYLYYRTYKYEGFNFWVTRITSAAFF
jgi:hypothetical protein